MALVRGRYHVTNPLWSLMGQPVNATQSDLAVRSNVDPSGINALTDGAALTTAVATAVAIPVEYGDIITKVSVFVGATAEGTGTNAWAALYSGIAVPALMAQSVSNTGAAALAASARFDFTLATAQLITPANAPQGFIYASVLVAATVVPTLVSYTVATAGSYPWYTNAPLSMGALTHGAALAATAPATITGQARAAITPVVHLA